MSEGGRIRQIVARLGVRFQRDNRRANDENRTSQNGRTPLLATRAEAVVRPINPEAVVGNATDGQIAVVPAARNAVGVGLRRAVEYEGDEGKDQQHPTQNENGCGSKPYLSEDQKPDHHNRKDDVGIHTRVREELARSSLKA
jgi:hypothetical protein